MLENTNLLPLSFRAEPEHTEACTPVRVDLHTDVGRVETRLQRAEHGTKAILWVFGAGGGLGGPAGGIYARLGAQFCTRGVSSLEVDYRRPGVLTSCIQDTRTGIAYLRELGNDRIVLVGHSFGGAVVLRSAEEEPAVVAVAALSSQTAGVGSLRVLAPRPLLFVHGEADEVLPPVLSRELHARATAPRKLILYPQCRHGLDQCRAALDRDLTAWLELALLD